MVRYIKAGGVVVGVQSVPVCSRSTHYASSICNVSFVIFLLGRLRLTRDDRPGIFYTI